MGDGPGHNGQRGPTMNQIDHSFTAAGFALTHQGGNVMNYQRNGDGFVQIISDEDGGGPVTDNTLPVLVGTYRVDGEGCMIEDDFANCAGFPEGWRAEEVVAEAVRQAALLAKQAG